MGIESCTRYLLSSYRITTLEAVLRLVKTEKNNNLEGSETLNPLTKGCYVSFEKKEGLRNSLVKIMEIFIECFYSYS